MFALYQLFDHYETRASTSTRETGFKCKLMFNRGFIKAVLDLLQLLQVRIYINSITLLYSTLLQAHNLQNKENLDDHSISWYQRTMPQFSTLFPLLTNPESTTDESWTVDVQANTSLNTSVSTREIFYNQGFSISSLLKVGLVVQARF